MERFSMLATNGWVNPIESDSGEWVRFEDVEKLVATCQKFITKNPKPETAEFKLPERLAV